MKGVTDPGVVGVSTVGPRSHESLGPKSVNRRNQEHPKCRVPSPLPDRGWLWL